MCALHAGSLLSFEAPVLDEDPAYPESSSVFPFFRFNECGELNVSSCTNHHLSRLSIIGSTLRSELYSYIFCVI